MKWWWPLGFIWSLPVMLVGLILWPFYGPINTTWKDGVFLCRVKRILGFKNTIGQTFGIVIFLKIDPTHEAYARIIVHEMAHTWQGFVLGMLFIPAYGIACLIAAAKGGHFYRDNWFEVQARAAAQPKT